MPRKASGVDEESPRSPDESRALSWGRVAQKTVSEVLVDMFELGAFEATSGASVVEVVSRASRRPTMGNSCPAKTLETRLWRAVHVAKSQAKWRATISRPRPPKHLGLHPHRHQESARGAKDHRALRASLRGWPLGELGIEKVDGSDSTFHRRVQRRIWVRVVQHSPNAQCIGHPFI